MADKPVKIALDAPLYVWSLTGSSERTGKERLYTTITVPFKDARVLFCPDPFDAKTGRGEQRVAIESHVRKMQVAFQSASYTPESLAVGMRPRHRENVKYKDDVVKLTFSSDDPLPLLNGGHRMEGLERMYNDAVAHENTEYAEAILNLPLTFFVHLNGNPQTDFINLQLGRTVESMQLFSIKAHRKMFEGKDATAVLQAMELARLLHDNVNSPFNRMVKFDTKSMAPVPVTTICVAGAADQSTSLVGLSKVGAASGKEVDARRLAEFVCRGFKLLDKELPDLLKRGMPLTPPPEGTMGSSTMLVGIGLCLAHRVLFAGRTTPSEDDFKAFLAASKSSMSKPIAGNYSAQLKRTLVGDFAAELNKDIECEKRGGVPVSLVASLGSSTAFNLPAIKKQRKNAVVAQ